MWFFSKIWAEFWDFLDTRQNYGIMIAKAIIMVPTLPPKRQERHFAGRRKPVETQRVFHSISRSGISPGGENQWKPNGFFIV